MVMVVGVVVAMVGDMRPAALKLLVVGESHMACRSRVVSFVCLISILQGGI